MNFRQWATWNACHDISAGCAIRIQSALDAFGTHVFVNLHQAAFIQSFFFNQFEKLFSQAFGALFGLGQKS